MNLLGQREPEIYGAQTLADLEALVRKSGQSLGVDVECYQSNHEGHLIDALHRARNRVQGVIFNPAGYTHTSVALRDAIAAIDIPVIEVHVSNPHAREAFRGQMVTSGACAGQIAGLGLLGYELALEGLVRLIRQGQQPAAEREARVEKVAEVREVRAEPAREPRAEPAREPKAESREAREAREGREREEREGKRRRRGRRGGRGRRRENELEGAPREAEREGGAEEIEQEPIDITERYANLKGVTVRRGLDVLAEEGEEEEVAPNKGEGLVTFHDTHEPARPFAPIAAAELGAPLEVTPARIEPKPAAPPPEKVVETAAEPEAAPEGAVPADEEALAEAEGAKPARRRRSPPTGRRRGGVRHKKGAKGGASGADEPDAPTK